MNFVSDLVGQVTGSSGGQGSGGGLGQLGDLAHYASLLSGGGTSSAASSASIGTILSMLKSGPSQQHASNMPGGLQSVFMQLLNIKQGITQQAEQHADPNSPNPSANQLNALQQQLDSVKQNVGPTLEQEGQAGTQHETTLNTLIAQAQAALTHLTANNQQGDAGYGNAGGAPADLQQPMVDQSGYGGGAQGGGFGKMMEEGQRFFGNANPDQEGYAQQGQQRGQQGGTNPSAPKFF